jgi:formylglycine-generating enzyme required for sulfatase activity
VDNVSWVDVQLFIRMLNRLTPGLQAVLPSEAQWEYAARAATGPQFRPALLSCAWFSANADDQSHPCATLQPNPWGLYDCLGNVAEWCNDSYAPYTVPLAIDPNTRGQGAPVIRGGSFRDGAGDCRLAQREHQRASFRSPHLGFRLAALAVPDLLPPPLPATEP